jgi:hypothetical protein
MSAPCQCVVCGESSPPEALRCTAGHATCNECLNGLVSSESERLRDTGGVVRCPQRGAVGAGTVAVCAAAPWTLPQLTPHLEPATLSIVASAALDALKAADEEAARLRAEGGGGGGGGGGGPPVAAPAAPAGPTPEVEERMQRYRREIIDSVLTLKCPRCSSAFVDYDGCDALTCGNPRCGCNFCALCLAPFRNSAECHAHMTGVAHHADGFRGVHGGQQRFTAYHRARTWMRVEAALMALPEAPHFKERLREQLQADMEGQPNGGGGGRSGGGGGGGGVLDALGRVLGHAAGGGGGGGGGAPTPSTDWWGVIGELLQPPAAHHSTATHIIRGVGAVGSLLLSSPAAPQPAERERAVERARAQEQEQRRAAEALAARGNVEQPASSLLSWAGGALALGAGAAAVVALLGGGGEQAPAPPAPQPPAAAAPPADELLLAARGALAEALGRPLSAAELALNREQVVAELHRVLGD